MTQKCFNFASVFLHFCRPDLFSNRTFSFGGFNMHVGHWVSGTDFSSLPLLFYFFAFFFLQLWWSSGQTRARGYFCCIRRLRKPDLAAAEDTSGGGGGGSQLGGTPLTIFAQKSVDPLFKLQIFVSFHKEKKEKRKVSLKNKTDSVKIWEQMKHSYW